MTYVVGDAESQVIGDAESLTVGPVLQVSGDLQVSGNLTVDNVRNLTGAASDGDNASAITTRSRALQSQASDSDDGSAIATRVCALTTQASDSDSATTIATRTQLLTTSASDADSLIATTTRSRSLSAPASDADSATAVASVAGGFFVQSADADQATASLRQQRTLTTSASDADSLIATASVTRPLAASGTDSDAAVGIYSQQIAVGVPGSDADSARAQITIPQITDPKDAILSLLSQATQWPGSKPLLKRIEETTPSERQHTTAPAIYAHKPVSDELTRLSADADLIETETVQLYIYTLDGEGRDPHKRCREYRTRVIQILQQYMDDNYTDTAFGSIEPVGATDARDGTIHRQTDHFIYAVDVETRRLGPL